MILAAPLLESLGLLGSAAGSARLSFRKRPAMAAHLLPRVLRLLRAGAAPENQRLFVEGIIEAGGKGCSADWEEVSPP